VPNQFSSMIRLFGFVAVSCVCACVRMAAAAPQHSAGMEVGPDGGPTNYYFSGISNPTGSAQINFNGSTPAYLNHITGGVNGGANGFVSIFDAEQNQLGGLELLALAGTETGT
jgi:hypothetical protein